MKNHYPISITNEIGKLKTVILHRPDEEINRIIPQNLSFSLFDDTPYLNDMQKEHDAFADLLRQKGVAVLYLVDFLTEIFKNPATKKEILTYILGRDILDCSYIKSCIFNYLMNLESVTTARCLIQGLSATDIAPLKTRPVISDYMPEKNMFYLLPLPNTYFMRDAAAVIDNGLSIHTMKNSVRMRESRIARAIYEYHPVFADNVPLWYDNNSENSCIEGGDILVVGNSSVVVGCSQRTDTAAVQILAENLFAQNADIDAVYAVELPKMRAFMHLDTVFTMVDYDQFIIYPLLNEHRNVVKITRSANAYPHFQRMDNLKAALCDALKVKHLNFIQSGGNDPVAAAREQWNDSTNTFVIAPGEVVAYSRNEISNEILTKNNIKVYAIKGSELVRGRGGPRCMTMPLCREKIH